MTSYRRWFKIRQAPNSNWSILYLILVVLKRASLLLFNEYLQLLDKKTLSLMFNALRVQLITDLNICNWYTFDNVGLFCLFCVVAVLLTKTCTGNVTFAYNIDLNLNLN